MRPSGPERLLDQIKRERGDERAAGFRQRRRDQLPGWFSEGSGHAPDHQGARRGQTEEKRPQHRASAVVFG
jgi:hypothetical protein